MSGFIYNGKSTKNILSDEITLATFDDGEIKIESKRDSVTGDTTIARPIPNEYGTTYDKLVINYGLVKKDGGYFSAEEQEKIESWLTSPKTSIDLQIYDDSYNSLEIYSGLFTNIEWHSLCGKWIGLMFEFTCNSAYAKKHFKQNFNITAKQTIAIKNLTDELEEYVYPVLDIYQTSATNATITIKNKTDNNNSMSFLTRRNNHMVIDCKNCIPYDQTTSGIITYKDLGWQDVGNIYWLRLLPGENQIEIDCSATVSVKVEFDYTCKRVGGWI